ncbi:uncharacterized protein LOC126034985 isoform X2 [Accipiter gentilis]|uniref:uncharacterized protein LOC126034985 isoform X2 n=1 Tax=Astur gentilis TaxID=8957 RepID=UPI002110D23B|nr:uncharacterized protein LOC126034985 isoform X2 [Accipiter gentilis]
MLESFREPEAPTWSRKCNQSWCQAGVKGDAGWSHRGGKVFAQQRTQQGHVGERVAAPLTKTFSAPWCRCQRGHPGHLQFSSTRDWELLLFRCSIDGHSPATRIVFCEDGVEEHSMKAQHGQFSYIMLRNVTLGSEGTYTCGYQHRNRNNWVRSSALSTPQNLTFTGNESSSQEGPWTPASVFPTPQTQIILSFSICTMMGLVAISLILLIAASYCAMKKGSKSAEMGKTKCIPARGRYLLPALLHKKRVSELA